MPGWGYPASGCLPRRGGDLSAAVGVKRGTALLLSALLLAALCLLPACTGTGGQARGTYLDAFDTVSVITVYAETQAAAEEGLSLLRERLLSCHRLFDIYHTYEGPTNLKSLNDAAGGEALPVCAEILSLLTLAEEARVLTGGTVSPTLGAVLTLWHTFREGGDTAPLPAEEALLAAAAHTAGVLTLDSEAGTAGLTDPQASLDVGAFAKGFTGEILARLAEEAGLSGAVIDIGGNITLYGIRPDGQAWRVGVRSPDGQTDKLLSLPGGYSVVSSGDYQRYVERDGVRYHHIIDPDTLYPATRHRGVTVVAADGTSADALSTALFILPYEEGVALAAACGVEALWYGADGSVRMSEGFAAFLAE